MGVASREAPVKVPEITCAFWAIKIAATTLGETGGDALTMSWLGETTSRATGMGYLIGTCVFAAVFAAAAWIQIGTKRFRPVPYWFAIIASTTLGTTLADCVTRSLGIGYAGGSTLLLALVLGTLRQWKRATGSVSVVDVSDRRSEGFYWLVVMGSQTLGTALGDWAADAAGLGYAGGMLVFASLLALVAILYRWSRLSHTLLFWAAFVLTRPLGAVAGDFLDKPFADGGLALSRYGATVVLLAFIAACVALLPQHAARRAH